MAGSAELSGFWKNCEIWPFHIGSKEATTDDVCKWAGKSTNCPTAAPPKGPTHGPHPPVFTNICKVSNPTSTDSTATPTNAPPFVNFGIMTTLDKDGFPVPMTDEQCSDIATLLCPGAHCKTQSQVTSDMGFYDNQLVAADTKGDNGTRVVKGKTGSAPTNYLMSTYEDYKDHPNSYRYLFCPNNGTNNTLSNNADHLDECKPRKRVTAHVDPEHIKCSIDEKNNNNIQCIDSAAIYGQPLSQTLNCSLGSHWVQNPKKGDSPSTITCADPNNIGTDVHTFDITKQPNVTCTIRKDDKSKLRCEFGDGSEFGDTAHYIDWKCTSSEWKPADNKGTYTC